jgi:hypothetical protein
MQIPDSEAAQHGSWISSAIAIWVTAGLAKSAWPRSTNSSANGTDGSRAVFRANDDGVDFRLPPPDKTDKTDRTWGFVGFVSFVGGGLATYRVGGR